jgi:hypothetical protein
MANGQDDRDSKNSAERLAATLRHEAQIELGNLLRVAFKPPETLSPQLASLVAQIRG